MNLFKKVAVIGDLHIGLKNNSIQHNEDCLNFIKWFINEAKINNCETAMVLGDYHNNRSNISILSLNYSMKCLELLNDNFDNVYMINGNHDLFYKENRSVHSVAWGQYLKNVHIINDIITDGDVTLCPWMVNNEFEYVSKLSSKYLFGHLELPHFMMNSMVVLPEHEGGAKAHHFESYESVFSGHFHKRQNRGNITYIGNCFPHNFGDNNDIDRGMMILEWGNTPKYIRWDDQPTYNVMNLSDIIENQNLLKRNSYNRVIMDIELSYEEVNYLKDTFTEQFGLRELSLLPKKNESLLENNDSAVKFEGVDHLVSTSINNIESNSYDKQLLLEIYKAL